MPSRAIVGINSVHNHSCRLTPVWKGHQATHQFIDDNDNDWHSRGTGQSEKIEGKRKGKGGTNRW